MTVKSSSPQTTRKIAALLAEEFLKHRANSRARVVALVGDLGSGKTTFVQGFARGFGLKRRMTSPTFLIVRNYGRLHHMDAYRIKEMNELETLGLGDIMKDPRNVVVVEWADRIKNFLPKGSLLIKFGHGRKPNERVLTFKNKK